MVRFQARIISSRLNSTVSIGDLAWAAPGAVRDAVYKLSIRVVSSSEGVDATCSVVRVIYALIRVIRQTL
jgi:hypothetical protein